MYLRLIRFLICSSLLCQIVLPINAQETSNDPWSFLIEPYLMFPSMKGTIGVNDLPDASVDADASDIFSNLKLGAMLNFEAYNDQWAIGTDLIYMKLKQDVNTDGLIIDGYAQAKQFAWEVSALRRLLPWLEAGVGGRFNKLTSDIELDILTMMPRTGSTSESWFDPIIIARIKNPSAQPVFYQLRGDLGGFGIGSDFTWQIQAYIGYRFSELFQVSAGYRIIGIDYETGSEENRFKYDIDTSGPVLRFGFNIN